jgi:D-alanine-D-alanine ligase
MNAPRHICVLRGGPSAEREVSLRSGAAVVRALRSQGHHVSEVDPIGSWRLPVDADLVFLALHGTYGEDGTVQDELDRRGVTYTGCDANSSRLAFDKVLTKKRLVACGVPTARFEVVRDLRSDWPRGWLPPVVLKPVRQGSSVGLQFVDRTEEWPAALRESLQHDSEVLVEERIPGREVTVAVLDGRALPVVEVRPRAGAYDYASKYTAGATEYLCPAPFDPAVTAQVQSAGLRAFKAVGGRDYGRVDIIVRPEATPMVLEVNTLPGMTETSLLPMAAAADGIGFAELCQRMVELAWERSARAQHEGQANVA